MSTIVYNGVNRCECGNLFLANAKEICPPCYKAIREVAFYRRAKARNEKRLAKIARRSANKNSP